MSEAQVIAAHDIEAIEDFLEECSDTDGCVYCIQCYPHDTYPVGSIVPSLCGKSGPKYDGGIDHEGVSCEDCAKIDFCPECGMYIWLPLW